MATLVQAPTTGDSSQSTLAFTSNVAANNLGICFLRVSTGDGTPTGITDTLGSTWTAIGSAISISTGIGYLYYTVFGSSGANTITIGGGATARILLEEVNGLGAGATLDSTNQGTGTSAAPSAGNISPAVASWIFGALLMTNYPSVDPTAGSGYTRRGSGVLKFYGEDQNSASGGTYSGGWTLPESNTWGAIIAAFKAAGGNNTTRTLDDSLTIFDEPIRGAKFGRTIDDLLTVFDDSYPFKIFEVVIDESYDVLDQLIEYQKFSRQLDDSNAVVDELLKAAIYSRLQSDNLVTFDDLVSGARRGVTATDSLVTADDLIAYRKFYRRLDDTNDVIDQLTASIGAVTLYVVTIDDSIVIYDDALRCVAYSRGIDEPLTIVDSLNKSVAYCRQSADALDCYDELYASRWFRQLIDEQVSVVDSLIASIGTPGPTSVTHLPVRIGLVRDFIKIGVIR